MAITATDNTGFEIEDGLYDATLSAWEETEPHPQYGPGIKLVWMLPDGNDKWQFVSQKLSPKSTLQAIVKTLGFQPVPGTSYELGDLLNPLIGRGAKIMVKTVDGPNGPQQKVTDILPGAKNGSAPKAAAPPKTDELCAVPGCGQELTHFSAKGTPFCKAHGPEDM